MSEFLSESGRRSMRPGIMNSVMLSQSAKYQQDQNTMLDLVNESEPLNSHYAIGLMLMSCAVLENRKANPTDKNDLLHVMLTGRDKETGLGLSDDNIKKNVSDHQLMYSAVI